MTYWIWNLFVKKKLLWKCKNGFIPWGVHSFMGTVSCPQELARRKRNCRIQKRDRTENILHYSKYITHLQNVQRAFLLKLFSFSVKQGLLPLIQLVSFPNPLSHALPECRTWGQGCRGPQEAASVITPKPSSAPWPLTNPREMEAVNRSGGKQYA